jgi:hypothetical protein
MKPEGERSNNFWLTTVSPYTSIFWAFLYLKTFCQKAMGLTLWPVPCVCWREWRRKFCWATIWDNTIQNSTTYSIHIRRLYSRSSSGNGKQHVDTHGTYGKIIIWISLGGFVEMFRLLRRRRYLRAIVYFFFFFFLANGWCPCGDERLRQFVTHASVRNKKKKKKKKKKMCNFLIDAHED